MPILGDMGRAVLSNLRIAREFAADGRAYARTSSWRPRHLEGTAQIQRDLTFWYHQVEKAFSLPVPRRPFGARAQENLEQILGAAQTAEIDSTVAEAAESALGALRVWNDGGEPSESVSPLRTQFGGLEDPAAFFESRHSCRNFNPSARVDEATLRMAFRLTQSTPSVCNRQCGRIHYFGDANLVQKALSFQNGNRGFGESVPHLAVITADRRAFNEASERNQRWVDGGLFAMTFVWVLQSLGLASCMLNWSMGVTATRQLRAALDLPEHEDVICMVAFGKPVETARRARSARLPQSIIVTEH
ncbi:nitroreductase family protein [Demequina salsinemoris]|uniref:nitroreductase family protein n=1 Tax=Demequina salsinemoris TaxID=577470 RepID=UPI000A06EDEB|nr:nitroreductase family protein [Demequina salsinemoris]